MKIAIILLALVGVAVAAPLASYGKARSGQSQVSRSDDGKGNYQFGYVEEHDEGATSRQEKGGDGWQQGSYQLTDKDGRKRTVNYVADEYGFRAQIDTNEPGVDAKQDPADVSINGNGNDNRQWSEPIKTLAIQAQPQLSLIRAQPQLSLIRAQPQLSLIRAQPQLNLIRAQPQLLQLNQDYQPQSWASGYQLSTKLQSLGSSLNYS